MCNPIHSRSKNGIAFYNAVELDQMFHDVTYTLAEGDKRQLVNDTAGKAARQEITYYQLFQILDDAGVDVANAIGYFNEHTNSYEQQRKIDVYDGLIEFVKNNKGKDIFVDEFPILMNSKCKISHFL